MQKITHVDIRMYRAGTGDCFVLKFFAKASPVFKMMIDGGTWSGTKKELEVIVKDLKTYTDNKIDLLVITHEHKDHVYLFNACKELFTNDFEVDEVWMAWSEDDQDEMVKEWKEKYGQKKKALAIASDMINLGIKDHKIIEQLKVGFRGQQVVNRFLNFASSLNDFKELHFSADAVKKKYKGGLKGMEVVKKEIAQDNIRYCKPGTVEKVSKLDGVNFYILGPPLSIDAIKDHGKHAAEGSIYDHNEVLRRSDSFSAAIIHSDAPDITTPFDTHFRSGNTDLKNYYHDESKAWRTIDLDWLVSGAGNLALRVNSGINNLSLAMAIEFESSKKVMLFPGDAEFGSWKSWHDINWDLNNDKKHFTEDLLNRTVFYKVAHHCSHNGTANNLGLKMMTSPHLVSMATLDFDKISKNWKSTMPNRGLLKDIINKTKGRFIIMNEKDLFYDFDQKIPLGERIEEERKRLTDKEKKEFKDAYNQTDLYKQYRLKVE